MPELLTEDEVRAERAKRSLRCFLEFVVWPVGEPETPFRPGFHIDAICEHLEAVGRREIRNLLITVPPRHTKSLCASVAWPTWTWIQRPETRFLFASFSSDLSIEHAVLSRRVIESIGYQRSWGDAFGISTDQNVKGHYENTRRGYRISTSVRGTTTGRGGDFLVGDDLHNLKDIDSDLKRGEVLSWYREVWSSRLNDPRTGCKVLIMQRGHQTDIAGYVLEQGNYEHLNLPTEYDPRRSCSTCIGWSDPRTEAGELLNPKRFGPTEVEQAKADLLATGFSTQHQQNPTAREGGMFRRSKFRVIESDALPTDDDGSPMPYEEVRYWDFAATEPKRGLDPDWTVGVQMRKYGNGLYVVAHVVRGQYGPAEGDQTMRSTAIVDGVGCSVREEQEPGSAGKRVIVAHTQLMAGFDFDGAPSTGKKEARALPFARQVDAGNVRLLKGSWNRDYIDELTIFNKGAHDDQVDASSGAFASLAFAPVPFAVMEAAWG